MSCCGQDIRDRMLRLKETLASKGSTKEARALDQTITQLDDVMSRRAKVLSKLTAKRPSK